jgi:hypothetical protein
MSDVEGRSIGGAVAAVRQSLAPERLLGDVRGTLWGLAFLFFCVGDVATTHVGLSMQGIVEAGPIVGPVLREYGLAAMLGLKGATVGLFYGAARPLPAPHSLGIPLGLTIVGVLVTAWNLIVIGLVAS